jgi:hypothetical protein
MAIGALNVGSPRLVTSSGNVMPRPGALLGIFCSTSTGGTVAVYDDPSTGTATQIVGTITLASGTWYNLPMTFAQGCNLVVAGAAVITVVVSG